MKSLFRFFNNSLSSVFLFVFTLLGLLVLVNQTGVAGQGASPWIKTEQTSIRLLTNVSAIGNSQNIQLGLQFKLEPGWKIYWRSPGDAGYPPRLNWKRSENLKKINFGWPLPIRFSVSGIQTIGSVSYTHLTLPTTPYV